jgi:hypothetical protein
LERTDGKLSVKLPAGNNFIRFASTLQIIFYAIMVYGFLGCPSAVQGAIS